MNRILALVEGQTEEAFLGRVLRPHLWNHDVDIAAKIVVTRRIASGPDRKGGVTSWGQVERDLKLLCEDTGAVAVTTLMDYYGLPSDVPGMRTRPNGHPAQRAVHVQKAIDTRMSESRMGSYLALHEFESLLYADPEECGNYLGEPGLRAEMTAAVSNCGGPELVNDGAKSAPSKRMLAAYPAYQKAFHGPALAERIGLPSIRLACPHFDEWVTWLESFSPYR